jgi:small subunit ribosomal protein S17
MAVSEKSSNKRSQVGLVVSDASDKTIVVRVETLVQHPLVKKYIRRHKKLMAHDPANECKVGDKVEIIEHRPLSKRKRWHLVKVLEKAV